MQKYAIEMKNITKTFLNGKVVANDNLSLLVKQNEIHALVGENGAGKSTLMSVLFGIYSPDYGSIAINGETVVFKSAKDANTYGLGMVHQHFKLIDEFTVFDNIILGDEKAKTLGFIKKIKLKNELNKIIKQYNFNLNLNQKVSTLTVGQQQKTEILKLLYRNANILIFDEPTAVLSKNEIASFLEMILNFKKQGKTIIIITHKLSEIKSIADWVTVIRHGKYVDDFPIDAKSIAEIGELIVGKKVDEVQNELSIPTDAKKVFEINNIKLNKKNKNTKNNESLSFYVREGEILAIAGVEGNGQSELALAIAGYNYHPEAKILINGVDINKFNIKKRIESGLSSVPEDRHLHGLILDDQVAFNLAIHNLSKSPFSKYGFISYPMIYKNASDIIQKYDVRGTTRGTSLARILSGGNQQKLVIGREFEKQYDVLLLVQPTRGMDLGAIAFIHKKIIEAKINKKAIILISYELDEIFALADTIAVMQNGKFLSIDKSKNLTRQKIGEIMVKGEENV